MMITVNFEKQLRRAFTAGQQSMLPKLMSARGQSGDAAFLANIPTTYEQWIAREEKIHPPVARL